MGFLTRVTALQELVTSGRKWLKAVSRQELCLVFLPATACRGVASQSPEPAEGAPTGLGLLAPLTS